MLGIKEARISMFIILYSYSPYLCKFLKASTNTPLGKMLKCLSKQPCMMAGCVPPKTSEYCHIRAATDLCVYSNSPLADGSGVLF